MGVAAITVALQVCKSPGMGSTGRQAGRQFDVQKFT